MSARPLIVESLRLWRSLNALTGCDTGFRTRGVMFVGEDAAAEEQFAAWLAMARRYDLGTHIVGGRELESLMPGASRTYPCVARAAMQ